MPRKPWKGDGTGDWRLPGERRCVLTHKDIEHIKILSQQRDGSVNERPAMA